MKHDVAVLFCDPKGTYSQFPEVDLWGIDRDARLYAGDRPVVTHPPCNLWAWSAKLNYRRYGGEHNRPGNDGGCFAAALSSVLRCGGVLEHPAKTAAFEFFGIPKPTTDGLWSRHLLRGRVVWVVEVAQSAYGCRARKLTWLLAVRDAQPTTLRLERPEGSHQIGWFDRKKPTLGKAEASSTPPAFAKALIQLAREAIRENQ